MFICKSKFNFIDKFIGVTKEGEQYVSLNVIELNGTKKYNFISKDTQVIDLFKKLEISRFAEVNLKLGFIREFNQEKRFSYWTCSLLGVD